MDIVLERILSLIPKKQDGSYVHGAKKDFADSLGLAHNLVTMWEKGQSSSYKNYLYEIAAKYNVSVEWLKGETEQKENPVAANDNEVEILELFNRLSSEEQARELAYLRERVNALNK